MRYQDTVGRPRTAAIRIPPTEVSVAPQQPFNGTTGPKLFTYEPSSRTLTQLTNDPIVTAINGAWRDRQQHGRLAYEAMAAHAEVSDALRTWLDFFIANPPTAKPRAKSASAKQREIADFANFVLQRLDWPSFVEGPIGMGLQFGFSLSEITTQVVRWKDRDYVSLDRIYPLPQASLDHGFTPRQEFGELSLRSDPRYRCFETDDRGRITKVTQFYKGKNAQNQVVWAGDELARILHFRHRGGDGNPFGESLFFPAFSAWADLHVLERIEAVFLDMGLPFILITYKSVDGVPRPDTHAAVLDILSKQELSGTKRVLVLPDASAESVAPSNPNFTEHVTKKQDRLSKQIRKGIGVPETLTSEANTSEGDSRNTIQVFHKTRLKARLLAIGSILEDLLRRFVESNYRDLDQDDYPIITWSIVTENELRVVQALFQQILPLLDTKKMPEVVSRMAGFIEPSDFPDDHKDSVMVQRPAPVAEAGNQPPPKEPGERRVRLDGQTDNPSSQNTAS